VKTAFALILATTAALSACTRVIERQTPAPAPIAPGACLWEGQQTSSGGTSCRDHSTFRCSNGTWEQTANRC